METSSFSNGTRFQQENEESDEYLRGRCTVVGEDFGGIEAKGNGIEKLTNVTSLMALFGSMMKEYFSSTATWIDEGRSLFWWAVYRKISVGERSHGAWMLT
ncbi:hypothetical protein L1887_11245 [Cichorium endivia]|nr:hypothetical protein L1887_11245 [Cichorium endivia]